MMLSMRKWIVCVLMVDPVVSFAFRFAGCRVPQVTSSSSSRFWMSAAPDGTTDSTGGPATTKLLSLQLEKPLGLLLEEVVEGADQGVKVQEVVAQGGSAAKSDFRDQLTGLQIASVMGDNVLNVNFDTVMEKIVDAPSPVDIEFVYNVAAVAASTTKEEVAIEPEFDVGTAVTINVQQEGKDDMAIEAKVGDNLRKVLLENDVELYRGLKKKMGNCGGGGQCTFCAVDFVESEGWAERSEYEDGKIGKWPRARLACLNNIQGPATIRVQ